MWSLMRKQSFRNVRSQWIRRRTESDGAVTELRVTGAVAPRGQAEGASVAHFEVHEVLPHFSCSSW